MKFQKKAQKKIESNHFIFMFYFILSESNDKNDQQNNLNFIDKRTKSYP